MSRKSHLTPFIAHGLRKTAERGITDNYSKRYIIPEPNCKPLNQEGQPLGMEKFASLFVFYLAGIAISGIIFVIEITIKPAKNSSIWQTQNNIDKLEIFIEKLTTDTKMKLYLLSEVKKQISKRAGADGTIQAETRNISSC